MSKKGVLGVFTRADHYTNSRRIGSEGIEPPLRLPNSDNRKQNRPIMEMVGFEPTTFTLPEYCSPVELHPLIVHTGNAPVFLAYETSGLLLS